MVITVVGHIDYGCGDGHNSGGSDDVNGHDNQL